MPLFIKWDINKACKMNESDFKVKNTQKQILQKAQGEATFINFNMKIIVCIILFKVEIINIWQSLVYKTGNFTRYKKSHKV